MPSPLSRSLLLLVAGSCLLAGSCGDSGTSPSGLREHQDAFVVSHILVARAEGRNRGEALVKIAALQSRLEGGESFAAVARSGSEDEGNREDGGFIGFVDISKESRFAGAVQALRPGETRGPIETNAGLHLIHRHSYEEGRRMEAATRIVVRGFIVSSREAKDGLNRSLEEARKIAEEAYQHVRAGDMTLAQAAQKYSDRPPQRPDAFLEVMPRREANRWLYDPLAKLEEGALAPGVVVGPGVFAVVARGPFLRSVVRHVLVAHNGSRPPELAIYAKRSKEDARAIAEKVLKEASPDGSNWSDLIERYSDDLPTATVQGSLGSVASGMLPPDMEAAILEIPRGRVAKHITESQAGFEIFWRVD